MDTPSIPAPRDAGEQEILANLEVIRDSLLLLKQDRTTYIRSQDVFLLYNQTIDEVRKLCELRDGKDATENRLDRVLDSVFQLLSLFFMTIGRISEAPAAYAMTSTIKRLIDHLTESNVYSYVDLVNIKEALDRLSGIVSKADDSHSPYLINLLSQRVATCKAQVEKLIKKEETMEDPLPSIHESMVFILRQISKLNTSKSKFPTSELESFKSQLKEIDEKRKDGHFVNEAGKVLRGDDEVSSLLDRCLTWADVVVERKGAIPAEFKATFDSLCGIRNDLEKIHLTHSWSLRETDLYDFQRKLDKIDEARVDGNWLDEDGKPAELYVQRTFLYLLRRSYGIVFGLMVASEPVSEALLPIFNQLTTLKRCLLEVKGSGGVSNPRELYPYVMKLNSVDNMRVDGKFMVNGDIPEGQGSVNELLADCFDLEYELRLEAMEASNTEA